MYLRQQIKSTGAYDFLAKVMNLPGSRTLADYGDSLDGNAPDGLCYETLKATRHKMNEYLEQKQATLTKDQID